MKTKTKTTLNTIRLRTFPESEYPELYNRLPHRGRPTREEKASRDNTLLRIKLEILRVFAVCGTFHARVNKPCKPFEDILLTFLSSPARLARMPDNHPLLGCAIDCAIAERLIMHAELERKLMLVTTKLCEPFRTDEEDPELAAAAFRQWEEDQDIRRGDRSLLREESRLVRREVIDELLPLREEFIRRTTFA